MAKVFTLTETGFAAINEQLRNLSRNVNTEASKALNTFSNDVAESAKQRVASNSSDEGFLLRSISPKNSSPNALTAEVNVTVFYAAFIEFGTRKSGASPQYTGQPTLARAAV